MKNIEDFSIFLFRFHLTSFPIFVNLILIKQLFGLYRLGMIWGVDVTSYEEAKE